MPTWEPHLIELDAEPQMTALPAVEEGSEVTGQKFVSCPKCGSPYVMKFTALDPRQTEWDGFECSAGDCGYTGTVRT